MKTQFYTYSYIRQNGTPFYYGKGSGDRAYESHRYQGGGIHTPKERGRILVQYWGSEEEAFEMEKWYIKLFGRKDLGTGILHNRTDGGDGASGTVVSLKTRKKLSEKSKGNTRRLGHKASEETKQKMSNSLKGRVFSEEVKVKLSLGSKVREARKKAAGFVVSVATRSKLSAVGLKRPRQTHCKRGHERSPENLYGSQCKLCMKILAEKTKAVTV